MKKEFFSQPDLGGVDPVEFKESLTQANLKNSSTHFPSILSRQPVIGDVVVFFPNPDDSVGRSNTAKVCPAIITRVWGPTGTCNLKIIPDHGPMQDRGSVSHKSGNIAGYSWCYQEEFVEGVKLGFWPPSEF